MKRLASSRFHLLLVRFTGSSDSIQSTISSSKDDIWSSLISTPMKTVCFTCFFGSGFLVRYLTRFKSISSNSSSEMNPMKSDGFSSHWSILVMYLTSAILALPLISTTVEYFSAMMSILLRNGTIVQVEPNMLISSHEITTCGLRPLSSLVLLSHP